MSEKKPVRYVPAFFMYLFVIFLIFINNLFFIFIVFILETLYIIFYNSHFRNSF